MAKWRDLIPPAEEIVFASNGNFTGEGPDEKLNVGFLVLSKTHVYLIYSKLLALSSPKMGGSVLLQKVSGVRVTGDVIRALEFDCHYPSHKKHVKFMSFDFDVQELADELEYAIDNL